MLVGGLWGWILAVACYCGIDFYKASSSNLANMSLFLMVWRCGSF
jgi:hypothetical protein